MNRKHYLAVPLIVLVASSAGSLADFKVTRTGDSIVDAQAS